MTALTKSEQTQLADLQNRQAEADWEKEEAERKAAYAAFKPLVDVLGDKAAVKAKIAELHKVAKGLPAIYRKEEEALGNAAKAIETFVLPALVKAQQLSVPTPAPSDDPALEETVA